MSDTATTFIVLLIAALIGGLIAYRLKQPLVLGYLLVGVAIGPHALGLVHDLTLVQAMATIGVSLLMLTMGLEVSFSQLRQVGRVGISGGMLQILITLGLGVLAAGLILHWSLSQSILFGIIISMSSTVVVLKILMDRGELDSVHGRIMVALLIFQDLVAVLMIVIQPILGGAGLSLWSILFKIGTAALFVVVTIIAGIWILPWWMGRVGGVRSRELFLLMVLVLALGAALGTQLLGLSAVFGAFLIGLTLRETRFAHQALAEVTPLRDIFSALFFISLGMLLDPRYVAEHWLLVITVVVVIIVIKFISVYGIVRLFRYSRDIALFTSAGLIQIGEFSFILAQGGLNTGLLSQDSYTLLIGSSIITMLLTPVSLGLASLASSRRHQTQILRPKTSSNVPLKAGDIIIAGFGRVGRNVAQGLQSVGISFSVIEIDPSVILKQDCGAVSCIYGDASNVHVMSQMDMAQAKVMVITFPDPIATFTTSATALAINPKLKIIARVHRVRDATALDKLGVQEMVSPEYEASVEFVSKVLEASGWEDVDIQRTLLTLRRDQRMTEFVPEEEK
jgi:monovalent cation:H+ antiporter-2, CPA2 family